jgi:endogenous inhibitor of DNA gyrase (YacG/DUF329 family)
MSKNIEVDCPTCKKSVTWNDKAAFRPFCSERCQQIDLGAWASESYTIPVEITDQWSDTSPTIGNENPEHLH